MAHNRENIGIGLIFILIGALWLSFKFNLLQFPIHRAFFDLWPMVFVVIGLSIIFNRHPIVRSLLWIAFFAVIIGYGYLRYQTDSQLPFVSGPPQMERHLVEENADRAAVNLKLGAGRLRVGSTDAGLLDYELPTAYTSVDETVSDGMPTYTIRNDQFNFTEFDIDFDYRIDLSPDALWDIDVDTGAIDARMDLTEVPVTSFDLDMGAGQMHIMLGDRAAETQMTIDAAASDITIDVHENVGARVKIDGALKSEHLYGVWIQRDGYWYTENYDDSTSRLFIDGSFAVGNLTINHPTGD
jgi:hypothetical protein